MQFQDRADAGRQLGQRVRQLDLANPVVLGLPRGGVPVAAQVARALGTTFDIFVARKIGAPGNPVFGIGAIAEGGGEPVPSAMAASAGLGQPDLSELAIPEREELARRAGLYRDGRPVPELAGRDVLVVDDGLATGVTAEAALRALRRERPGRLVLAVPVCAAETGSRLATIADDLICLRQPADFVAVGEWYASFPQTSDDEVLRLLHDQPRPPQ
jgi:putative phosphoribosyl transferase